MTVSYAAPEMNRARNIACNYLIQQQPVYTFTTVPKVMVKPREVRHQYWCTTQYRTRLTDRPGMFHLPIGNRGMPTVYPDLPWLHVPDRDD